MNKEIQKLETAAKYSITCLRKKQPFSANGKNVIVVPIKS